MLLRQSGIIPAKIHDTIPVKNFRLSSVGTGKDKCFCVCPKLITEIRAFYLICIFDKVSNRIPQQIILGLDPGTTVTGYGIICVNGRQIRLVKYGVIRLGKAGTHEGKLKKIFDEVLKLLDEFTPDEVALEAPFYGKNVQSMLKLGRAQGVAMAAALSRQIPITEYAPKKVKQAVTGNGNASKEQVARTLLQQFGIRQTPHLLDATDALAVALCHHGSKHNLSGSASKKISWRNFVELHPHRIKNK